MPQFPRHYGAFGSTLDSLRPCFRTTRRGFVVAVSVVTHRARRPVRHAAPKVGWLHPRVTVAAVCHRHSRQSVHAWKFPQDATRIFHHPAFARIHFQHQVFRVFHDFLRQDGMSSFRLVLARAAAPMMADAGDTERFAGRRRPDKIKVAETCGSLSQDVGGYRAAESRLKIERDIFVSTRFDFLAALFATDARK